MPPVGYYNAITFRMHWDEGNRCRHHAPHVHAWSAGKEIVISIRTGDPLVGKLDNARLLKEAQDWVKTRKGKLMKCWKRAVNNEPPGEIR